jgi:hypothetical protein
MSKQETDDRDVTATEALDDASGSSKKGKFFGAPAMLQLTHDFLGALPSENFEDLITRVRELMHDPGVVERNDASFMWSSTPDQHALQPEVMVVVRVDGLHTKLIATDRLDALIVRAFGKAGGMIVTLGLLGPIAVGAAIPALGPALLVGWLGGAYGAMRTLYKRLVATRAKQLKKIFDSMVREIEPVVA